MKTQEWRWINKSTWGDGPWQDEPDKVQWRDENTGLPCLIHRSYTTGALCGYVGVPPGHKLYGNAASWDAEGMEGLRVHGGINYGDKCQAPDEATGAGVCHHDPDGPEVWWLGFDCGHAWDVTPQIEAYYLERDPLYVPFSWPPGRCPTYKTVDYVRNECRDLAQQLHTMTTTTPTEKPDGPGQRV